MAGFTPVEEVERISMGPRESAEKVVRDFCKGGVGGRSIYYNIVGGFGGGGGAFGRGAGGGGGGGGYSGGSSGDNDRDSCGGGGGSYNDGNHQDYACCYRTAGHGQVAITLL